MKNALILKGSPRKQGNTNALTDPFIRQMEVEGWQTKSFDLYDMHLEPCYACRSCQQDWNLFGCVRQDDMQEIYDAIKVCNLLVFATPVYCWYCTPPVKTVMDRMMYGMNKYYGEKRGPSLWTGKRVALITTCGYRPEKGADLLQEGFRRYCKHSQMDFAGMLAERHLGYDTVFMDEEKAAHARAFARKLAEQGRPCRGRRKQQPNI